MKAVFAATLLALTASVAFAQDSENYDPGAKRHMCSTIGCPGGHLTCGYVSGSVWEWFDVQGIPVIWPVEHSYTCYESSVLQ